MTKSFDAQGRQIVSLSWLERGALSIGGLCIVGGIGWVGHAVMETRDNMYKLLDHDQRLQRTSEDHETRIRSLERPHQ